MKPLRRYSLKAKIETGVIFDADGIHELRVDVLEQKSFRVRLFRDSRPHRLERTWAVANGHEDLPPDGRDRTSLVGFTCPSFSVSETPEFVSVATNDLELRIVKEGARLEWWSGGVPILAERTTGSIALSRHSEKIEHCHRLEDDAGFYGLGEASGPLNRRGRRFEMRNLDAMGYDAESGGPLYKHFPFLIHRSRGVALGLFYDSFATTVFDLGREIDNYHGPYFSYRAESGDLDLYVILGPKMADVTKAFTHLTGRPMMPPKWSLGYSGSTMSYTDAPDASQQLSGFLNEIEKHDLPCSSFHLSSGYTSIGEKRYVFNWNRAKFPDPAAIVSAFRNKGVHFVPNVKPVLLTDHPRYAEARALFVRDSDRDEPELSQFWGGLGSHLDFTNPATSVWWKARVKESLLDLGIDAIWNDNNEFEIWDDEARCHGFGREFPIKLGRPVQTLLMAQASRAALLEARPEQRPFVVSRSGMPGLQRYAQTWSGDNTTAWKTLRFNLAMALNLSLSGVSNIGHDVGGFSGPRPEPELFLRWIQHGIFYPRFVIHSWKEEGASEPWMYPELLPQIRALFALRASLEPYFYQLLRASHERFEPFLRPLFYDFENDPRVFDDKDSFMIGPDLLVANVFTKGQTVRTIFLPPNPGGWFELFTGKRHMGGISLELPVTLDSVPLFARAGSVIPMKSPDGSMELRFFGEPREGSYTFFDDDGESFPAATRNGLSVRFEFTKSSKGVVELSTELTGDFRPPYTSIKLIAEDPVPLSFMKEGLRIGKVDL